MTTAGQVLQLVRTGQAETRADLGRLTGLSRTAISSRLTSLEALNLITEDQSHISTGGRPPGMIRFRPDSGVVLAIAIGRSRVQLAVADLAGTLLVTEQDERPVESGPEETMAFVVERLEHLLAEREITPDKVRAFGCTIPGTIDYVRGAGIESQILAGWGGVQLSSYLQKPADAPVYVDNDANMLALSERRGHLTAYPNLLVVKASTGLGIGIVASGRLVRGGRAAAGELGHMRSAEAAGLRCRCGEIGCLEAIAGGWALVQRFQGEGRDVHHIRELIALANDGDVEVRSALREAGRRIGKALTPMVALLNPDAVVFGGDMAEAYDVLVAGVRETLYDDLPAPAGQYLDILHSTYREEAGLVGCAQLAIERVVGVKAVDRAIALPSTGLVGSVVRSSRGVR